MIKEFKAFIMRGNVVDLAVAFIMGGAFGAIVSSLVKDIIMPFVAGILGTVDFSALSWPVGKASVNYGLFINATITFLIVAFAMFMLIKAMNASKKPALAAVPTSKECPYCLSTVSFNATRCPNCTSELKA